MEFAELLGPQRLTPQEIARLVAQVIRLKPQRWNQASWYHNPGGSAWSPLTVEQMLDSLLDAENPACRTTGCVAGWTVAFTQPEDTVLFDQEYARTADGVPLDNIHSLARDALGLSAVQADYLFSAYRSRGNVLRVLDAIAGGRDWERIYDETR